MSKNNLAERFYELVCVGMRSAGSNITPTLDHDIVVIRNVFVEFKAGIEFYWADDPNTPFQTLPLSAMESAAAALCINVLTGVITRSIENSLN